MQMFPDDLPLANIDADGYCCHFMRSSVRPTIHGLGFVYCIQSAWKKWPTIWHADVSRWLTLSIHGCLWILLLVCLSVHLSVCSFTAFSGGCAFADKSLQQNKRGGVIIYVRQDLHDVCETTIFNLPSGIEAAQLDINSTLTIVVVYRSPAVPIPQLNNVLNKITGGHRTRVAAVTLDNMAEDAVAASASLWQILTVSIRYCGPAFVSWLSMLWDTLTRNSELQWFGISSQFRLELSRGDEGVGHVCFPGDEGVGRPWRGYRCVQMNVGPV